MDRKYESGAHTRHLLLYHFVFVCKYRRQVFSSTLIANAIKRYALQCSYQHSWKIDTQEIDPSLPDHYHVIIRGTPDNAPSEIVHDLKQYVTYYMWQNHSIYLKNFYWKKHHLWHRGYFVSSLGNVAVEIVMKYIEEQGY